MSNAESAITRPRILLATDLTSRSDRALDRAVLLTRQWNGELLILHALQPDAMSVMGPRSQDAPSWQRPADPARAAEARIRRDLKGDGIDLRVMVEDGAPAKAILDVAERERCHLIVLGTARDDTFGRMLPGSTDDDLVRRSPVSVLVVNSRPNGPYRHVLVGTDFTEESRHGLLIALKAFPDAKFTLMHAVEQPYRLRAPELAREFHAMGVAAMTSFLDETDLSQQARSHIQSIVEHGPPELMFRHYAEERGVDLTVIGAFGRGLMFHLLIGGNAPRIVDATPGDVLVVRAPKLAPE